MTNVPMQPMRWPQHLDAQRAEVRHLIQAALQEPEMVALLRFVAVRDEDKQRWQALFGRIDVCRSGDFEFGPQFDYGNVRTLTQLVPGPSFGSMLEALLDGTKPLECAGITLSPLVPIAQWEAQKYASNAGYAAWPCVYFRRSHDGAAIRNTFGPLASADKAPFFSDVWSLVGEVAQFGVFHGDSDARTNAINIFVWDYSGRIADVGIAADGDMLVSSKGKDLSQLALRGQFSNSEGRTQIRFDAKAELRIRPEYMPDRVELALVDPEHRIVDRVDIEWAEIVKPAKRTELSADIVARTSIERGECAAVEFKPFVRLDGQDVKWTELFETAIAMTNGRGGVILVGIDNHGSPMFSPAELRIVAGADVERLMTAPTQHREQLLEAAILKYANALRDRIEQHVNRSLFLRCRVAWLGSTPVLLLEARRGAEPPYMDRRDNSVWFRANATTRRATESELAELLAQRKA